jgi:PAS domain S-box-containing protein
MLTGDAIEESALRFLVQEAPLGIVLEDGDRHIRLVNSALCSMLGYTSEELVGTSFSSIADPADDELERPLFDELNGGSRTCCRVERRFLRKNGERVWGRASVVPWRGTDSNDGFVWMVLDLTELRHAQRDLLHYEERLSLALQASHTGIWELNAHTGLISWTGNHGLTADGASEQMSTSLSEFLYRVHPEDRNALEAATSEALREGQPFSVEFRLIDSRDRVRWILCKGKAVGPSAGPWAGVLGVNVDITELKQAEIELHRVMGRLIQAQEEERRRISGELHDDISQRLALLSVELASVANSLRREERSLPSALDNLQRGIEEVASDVHGLSHQLHSTKLQNLGLRAALRELGQQVAEQHGIQVKIDAGNLTEGIPEDAALCLFRVAQEAINNVVKHSHAECASVTISQQGNLLRLYISDSGVGFDTTTRSSGIGLAGMRERVRFLGGTLSIRSALGEGTEITAEVRIPGFAKSASAGSA